MNHPAVDLSALPIGFSAPASSWINWKVQRFSSAPRWSSARDLTDRNRAGLLGDMRPTIAPVLVCAVSAFLIGCNKPAAPSAPAESSPPAPVAAPVANTAVPAPSAAAPTSATATAPGAGKYGAPLSSAEAIAAKTVIADPLKWNDKDIKLTGRVSGVCQKKGCWMTLTSGEPEAPSVRISFKDYGFFVPKDCMGKAATVEGHFVVKTIPVAEAQHYADDAAKEGSPARKVTAPEHTLALVATGVEIL